MMPNEEELGSAVVARETHNLEVVGSNPTPAIQAVEQGATAGDEGLHCARKASFADTPAASPFAAPRAPASPLTFATSHPCVYVRHG